MVVRPKPCTASATLNIRFTDKGKKWTVQPVKPLLGDRWMVRCGAWWYGFNYCQKCAKRRGYVW